MNFTYQTGIISFYSSKIFEFTFICKLEWSRMHPFSTQFQEYHRTNKDSLRSRSASSSSNTPETKAANKEALLELNSSNMDNWRITSMWRVRNRTCDPCYCGNPKLGSSEAKSFLRRSILPLPIRTKSVVKESAMVFGNLIIMKSINSSEKNGKVSWWLWNTQRECLILSLFIGPITDRVESEIAFALGGPITDRVESEIAFALGGPITDRVESEIGFVLGALNSWISWRAFCSFLTLC